MIVCKRLETECVLQLSKLFAQSVRCYFMIEYDGYDGFFGAE